ncbi:hypothetical protein GCM10008949_47520 [Deinococcus humi]|nr:hypothetical protein GCM10008949_47520 [Deinococcus humi]
MRAGRCHNAKHFYIALPVPPPATESGNAQSPLVRRYDFRLIAVYDERGGQLRVENAADIERENGIDVGADGWRQLIALLPRFGPDGEGQGKPGEKAGVRVLIYREDRGGLALYPHVQQRYRRALHTLEALQRTVREGRREGEALRETPGTAEWLNEVLGQ